VVLVQWACIPSSLTLAPPHELWAYKLIYSLLVIAGTGSAQRHCLACI
jgi:hypothetical protein